MSVRIGRGLTVLLVLALSGLLAATTRAVWVSATAADAAGTPQDIPITGASASPAVLALALVGLAAGLALLLTSRLVRILTGAVLILAGLGAAAAAIAVLARPTTAATSGVLEATSIIGRDISARTTPWPVLAIAPAVAIAACGALALLRGAAWDRSAARFARAGTPARAVDPQQNPAAAWDALTSGEDPTDGLDAQR